MIKEIFLICALAAPATTWKPPLTEADLILHEFMARMTQAKTMEDVIFIHKPWTWPEVRQKTIRLSPGGFVLIEGRQILFHNYFIDHNYMHMPFVWRKFHIYKKSLDGLYLVKTSA